MAAVTKKQRLLFCKSRDFAFWRQGEIDLVCREGKELVFTEVKYRSDVSCGSPFEAVDFRKQEKIRRTALFYLCRYGYPENTPCRFDVVGILGDQVELIQDAF